MGQDLTPQAIHRLQRYSNTVWAEHRDFSYGMCRDLPSYAMPEGAVYDATDWLFDTPGKARKRGGIVGPFSGTQTSRGHVLARVANPEFTADRIYMIGGNADTYLWKTSDGTTVSGTTTGNTSDLGWGRPIEHMGFTITPITGAKANIYNPWSLAGSKFTTGAIDPGAPRTLATPASVSFTSGSPTMTIAAGDTAKFEEGQFIHAISGTNHYYGRVMSVSGTNVKVWPVPTFTWAAGTVTPIILLQADSFIHYTTDFFYPGCGASFQNRIIFGDINYDFSGSPQRYQQRVVFSILPTETAPPNGAINYYGATYLLSAGFPPNNFFDIPSAERIMAMEPVGEGQLLILTPTRAYRLTGNLTTQTATSSGYQFDVREISSRIGCLNDLTVVKTTRGVIFAAEDGVYAYDGSQLRPLMQDRIAQYYRDIVITNLGFGPLSAQYVRDHYILRTTGDVLVCNLQTLAWSRFTGGCARLVNAIDPGDQSAKYALRAVELTGGSFPGGQVMKLDNIFAPTSANRSDGDGTAVAPILKTKTYVEGDPNTRKRFRRVQVEYDMRGGSPTLTTASDTKMKVADASYVTLTTASGGTTLGTTSATSEATYDTMKALARGVAIEHRFTQAGGSDSTELLGIKHGFQPLREGRSA